MNPIIRIIFDLTGALGEMAIHSSYEVH